MQTRTATPLTVSQGELAIAKARKEYQRELASLYAHISQYGDRSPRVRAAIDAAVETAKRELRETRRRMAQA